MGFLENLIQTVTGEETHNITKEAKKPSSVSLDDYEVFRTLGVGSFGRVQLVRDRKSGEFYALKRMRKTQIIRQRQVEHTNNERILLGTCSGKCPFLVSLHTAFQDDRYLYLVLEYVCGGELFSLLRKVKVRIKALKRIKMFVCL